MKIDAQFLAFPKHLPNDVEGFIYYYPQKYPPIIPYFEEVATKIGSDPLGYKDYGYWAQEEMFAGLTTIQQEYEAGDDSDLTFLVNIDQKLNKLFCYRFWVVNYLFADGSLHEFYVDNLKNLTRKIVDITEDIEDYEHKIIQVQRDLLQTDYADLYLQQALNGVDIIAIFEKNPRTKPLLEEALKVSQTNNKQELEKLWDRMKIVIEDEKDPDHAVLQEKFSLPLTQVKMRKTITPFYAFLTHVVEFKEENEHLMRRYEEMKQRIKNLIKLAEAKLLKDDFSLFKLCYNQARNFSMFKDVMGEVDPFLLPFWFGVVHKRIKELLSKENHYKAEQSTGHGAMFSHFVWFLPKDLKDKVMTPDYEPYQFAGDRAQVLASSAIWNAWPHPIDKELIK